jgi:hypothetical protein
MNTVVSIGMLLVGVFILSLLVSYLMPRQEKITTIYVEQPSWRNYHGWWGHYGAGLPGWGHGRSLPPPPPPHPKPSLPPAPSPSSSPAPAPAP